MNAYAVTGTTLDFGVGNPPPAGTNTLEIVYLGLKADPSPIQDQTLGLNAIMRTNAQTIDANMSVPSTVNAQSAGPITISDPYVCLLYTSPSPRDLSTSRMPSSA